MRAEAYVESSFDKKRASEMEIAAGGRVQGEPLTFKDFRAC